ncbi:MAG: squalene/phytoene synthase family protein [Chloroflexi bacterium]|nr:squalene/phytoene synthase family protein [Chloroflexota bacterium]
MPLAASFRSRARTFWFAARFVPADRRASVCRLYAFARYLDDLVDEPAPDRDLQATRSLLHAWRFRSSPP